MIQEILARTLSLEIGVYKHAVGSLHLYDNNKIAAQQFLGEGYQSTQSPMPNMPLGDPWIAIRSLIVAESEIRNGDIFDATKIENINEYWVDLIRLLQVYRYYRDNDPDKMMQLRKKMSSSTYHPFIDKKLKECQRKLQQ
jgi:thymidylate synthase